mgnify:CR=1 FL=1
MVLLRRRPPPETAAEAAPGGLWDDLGAQILQGAKGRADYFKTAPNPYGSEFAYDTTGQEEVGVWGAFFNASSADPFKGSPSSS